MATRRIKAILEAEDRASKSFLSAKAAIAGLGAAAAAVGAVQIGRTLVQGIGAAVKASADFESATVRLAVALANQGENTRDIRGDLLRFARQLTDISLATETQIISALAQAKALGASTEAAKKLTAAATDLAAATGVDMETAFRQVNRTLGGYAGELGEIFPELKDLTAEQLKAGEAADLLARKVGGAGAAGDNTLNGALNNLNSKLTQLKVAVGEGLRDAFKETINTALLPTIESLESMARQGGIVRRVTLELSAAVLDLTASGAEFVSSPLARNLFALIAFQMVRFKQELEGVNELLKSETDGNMSAFIERLRQAAANLRALAASGAAQELSGSFSGIPGLLFNISKGFEQWKASADGATESVEAFREEISVTAGEIITASDALSRLIDDGLAVLEVQLQAGNASIERSALTIQRAIRGQAIPAALQLGDVIVDAAGEGSEAFDRFLQDLLRGLAAAIIKALILRAILASLGGGGGGDPFQSFAGFNLTGFRRGGIVGAQRGFIVPGIDRGGDSQLIAARPGEAVLPKELTDFILNGGGGAGSEITVNVRTDLPATVEAINTGVDRGSLRLVASRLRGTRITK